MAVVPDFQSGWLAPARPVPDLRRAGTHARVVSLVDFGAWCDPDKHAGPPPPEFAFDPAHQSICPYSADNRAPKED